MTFDELGLSPEVLRAIDDAGYETPTPIQEQAIPFVLMGRDVLGCAQTGTGKTASFTLPMIEILASGRSRARMARSLIITPTRELATQIAENFETYGKYHKLSMALLIGGVSFDEQNAKLDRGVDVLIATPGRLLDHFERGRILLTDIKILVIDEADRMMDMGFMPDVEKIVSLLPPIRQTLFFSATMPPEIRRIADKFLMNPKEITITPKTATAETVEQFLTIVDNKDFVKRDTLRRMIRSEAVDNAIVFCNRKRDVDTLNRSLIKHGFKAAALHGDMSQPARLETLDAFKNGATEILVASDVAARGLDLPKVSHVFNYDVPMHAEDYVHRIGRTGRAGREGRALTIATSADGKFLDAVQKFIGKKFDPIVVEGVEETEISADEPRRVGRRRSGEGAKKSPRRRGRKAPARKKSDTEAEKSVADEAAPTEPTPQGAAPAETSPTPPAAEKPRAPRNRKPAPKRQRSDQPAEEAVVGMGAHVPAFMLRSPASEDE
ncbi:MAG: DEAD/DEAH box helicase [Alphaproteobacteria bacterium]|nr:DEAD/DEAH box helicase [Alphaproteobacteria bacterium]